MSLRDLYPAAPSLVSLVGAFVYTVQTSKRPATSGSGWVVGLGGPGSKSSSACLHGIGLNLAKKDDG